MDRAAAECWINVYVEGGRAILGEPRGSAAEADAALIPRIKGVGRFRVHVKGRERT